MNTRERKAPVVAVSPVFERKPAPASVAAENGQPHLWEDWFRHASWADRAEMIALADRQGFLYSHQLPSGNGHGKSRGEPALQMWQQLLEGKGPELPPLAPIRLPQDADCAVARILASPDLYLLQVAAEADATPLLTRVVGQLNGEGKRILLLAKSLKHLDPLIAAVEQSHRPFLLRYNSGTAQPWEGETQPFRDQMLSRARFAQGEAEAVCQRRSAETSAWTMLQELTRKQCAAVAEIERLRLLANVDAATVAAELHAPLEQLRQGVLQQSQTLEEKRTRLLAAAEVAEKTLAQTRESMEAARPACDSLRGGRWWTWTYWQARRIPDLMQQFQTLQERLAEQQTALEQTRGQLSALAVEKDVLESGARAHEAQLVQDEVARRRGSAEVALADVQRQLEETQRQIADVRASFQDVAFDGEEDGAYAGWLTRKERDEESCQFARTWASFLENSAGQFVRQLPRYAQVVACDLATALRHADFADGTPPFDLVILLGAEDCVETDLLKIARKAKRWVLVGNPQTAARNGILCVSAFQRLWKQLAGDAESPCRWFADQARWTCQLRCLSDGDVPFLERESLADFPEIELHILALPGKRPVLAQVVFPDGMTLAEAKSFIYRELQELAVQSEPSVPCWQETDDAVVLHLVDPQMPADGVAEIEAGVHEEMQSADTARFVFAKASGWTCERALEWADKSLPRRDLGRTLRLSQ